MERKIIGLALALVLFAASGLWAQELKFDGYLNSGLGFVISDEYKNKDDIVDPYLKAIAVDAEHHGYRFRLNGSYTNEEKNAGAKFRLQSQTNLGSGYITLPYAFGWVSFFENKVTVNGGIVEDSTWTTGDWWLASDSVSHFAGLGSLLKITPIDGLALGVGGYTINRNSGSSNNVLNTSNLRGTSTILEEVKWTYHGAYTLKDSEKQDIFRVGVSYRMENTAGMDPTSTPSSSDLTNMYDSMFYGEFRFLKVKALTAVVATRMQAFGEEFESRGNIVLSESFGYKINDSLSLGLNAVQFLYNRTDANDDKIDMDPSLLFNLWGSYAIGNVVPRLDLVYFMNGTSGLVSSENDRTWQRKQFLNKDYATKDDTLTRMSLFSARPSVKINLDNRTFLEIGDMFNFDFGDKDGAYGDLNDAEKTSRITNAFYIDVKLSF